MLQKDMLYKDEVNQKINDMSPNKQGKQCTNSYENGTRPIPGQFQENCEADLENDQNKSMQDRKL